MFSDMAPTAPPACPEEQIASIDEEILSLEEETHQRMVFLSDLRAKRNSLLPVYRLPPETLETVFIHGAHDFFESNDDTPARRIPAWVNVSYVCSHWRNVALKCATLWTYHFNTSLRWTEELLLRSKQAPLKIAFIHSFRYNENFWWETLLDALLRHAERIQDLRLPNFPTSLLPAELSFCATHLETLDLDLFGDSKSISITGDEPRLRTMRLNACLLPWCLLNLSKLQVLVLRYVDSPSPVTMARFLAILSGMPNLTVLHLAHTLSSAVDFVPNNDLCHSANITFPHLTYLVITEPLPIVVALLSSVDIPPNTRVELKPLIESRPSVGDLAPIRLFLAGQFSQQPSGPVFRSLLLKTGDTAVLTFGLKCEPLQEESAGDDTLLKITLEFKDELTTETMLAESDIHRVILDICRSLPLTNTQYFHAIRASDLLADTWKDILGCLDGLRHMKLSGGYVPDLSFLSLTSPESNQSSSAKPTRASDYVFVPELEELWLNRILFESDGPWLQGSGTTEKAFFDVLSTRKGLQDRLTMTSW